MSSPYKHRVNCICEDSSRKPFQNLPPVIPVATVHVLSTEQGCLHASYRKKFTQLERKIYRGGGGGAGGGVGPIVALAFICYETAVWEKVCKMSY